MSTNKLQKVNAQNFRGETASDDNDARTIPNLLREIADWMDANQLDDTKFMDLSFTCNFENSQDDWHYSSVLYHLDDPSEANS